MENNEINKQHKKQWNKLIIRWRTGFSNHTKQERTTTLSSLLFGNDAQEQSDRLNIQMCSDGEMVGEHGSKKNRTKSYLMRL